LTITTIITMTIITAKNIDVYKSQLELEPPPLSPPPPLSIEFFTTKVWLAILIPFHAYKVTILDLTYAELLLKVMVAFLLAYNTSTEVEPKFQNECKYIYPREFISVIIDFTVYPLQLPVLKVVIVPEAYVSFITPIDSLIYKVSSYIAIFPNISTLPS